MGCILFEMMSYYPPFSGANMKALALSIVNDPVIDIPLEYSPEINLLIKKMLNKDPL